MSNNLTAAMTLQNVTLQGQRIYFFTQSKKRGGPLEGIASIARALGAEVVEDLNGAVDIYVKWDHSKTIEKDVQRLVDNGAKVLKRYDLVELLFPDSTVLLQWLEQSPSASSWNALDQAYTEFRNKNSDGAITYTHPHISGGSIQRADLCGFQFVNVALQNLDLSRVNAADAVFANLTGCNFKNANLSRTKFEYGKVEDCNFEGATLRDATLYPSAVIRNCSFRAADLRRIHWETSYNGNVGILCYVNIDVQNSQLQDANLPMGQFQGWNFAGANLSNAHFAYAKFPGANLSQCDLSNADLACANFMHANLSGANLQGCFMPGAVLSGANIAGADFTGANVNSADTNGLDLDCAIGLKEALDKYKQPVSGLKLQEFENLVFGSFTCDFSVQMGEMRTEATITHDCKRCSGFGCACSACEKKAPKPSPHRHCIVRLWIHDQSKPPSQPVMAKSYTEALLVAGRQLSGGADVQLHELKVSAAKHPQAKALAALTLEVICEVFAIPVPDEATLKSQEELATKRKNASREGLLRLLGNGPEGIESWNRAANTVKLTASPFKDSSLEGLAFRHWQIRGVEVSFHKSNFKKCDLRDADIDGADFRSCDFSGANLERARFTRSKLQKANFSGTSLNGCSLSGSYLQGTDLSKTSLDTVDLSEARFDNETKFPEQFQLRDELVWLGSGPDPRKAAEISQAHTGAMDFPTCIEKVSTDFDSAIVKRTMKMLQSESLRLYLDVTDDTIIGVVHAQDSRELSYACRLTSDGSFACSRPNLWPCGSVHGALCQHLLILVLIAAKKERLPASKALAWMIASKAKKPILKKDLMAGIFLRFKDADDYVDWRPTEFMAEDYYSF